MESATTLKELFPGNMGRLRFIRVMLRARIPQLAKHDWETPLTPELLERVRAGIAQDERN